MEEMVHCQSCGMPLENQDVLGTDSDGSLNQEYCSYCYQNGEYVDDMTMDQMIDISLTHMKESGVLAQQNKSEAEVRGFLYSFFPELKRWKK